MAKSVGAGMGQAGWDSGQSAWKAKPFIRPASEIPMCYTSFLACVFHNISTQGCIKWDPKECK